MASEEAEARALLLPVVKLLESERFRALLARLFEAALLLESLSANEDFVATALLQVPNFETAIDHLSSEQRKAKGLGWLVSDSFKKEPLVAEDICVAISNFLDAVAGMARVISDRLLRHKHIQTRVEFREIVEEVEALASLGEKTTSPEAQQLIAQLSGPSGEDEELEASADFILLVAEVAQERLGSLLSHPGLRLLRITSEGSARYLMSSVALAHWLFKRKEKVVPPRPLPHAIHKVFFATDRKRETADRAVVLNYSGNVRDDEKLETGWTNVSIPSQWKDGTRRAPGELGREARNRADIKQAAWHIMLLPGRRNHRVYQSDKEERFYLELTEELELHNNELLIFIHGYNTSFQSAIRNAAQLAYDLQQQEGAYKGAVLAYDWASHGSLLRYGFLPFVEADRERAYGTAPKLADFLNKLAARLQCKVNLHLVCHSMGNYVLYNTLQALEGEGNLAAFNTMFRTLTFAAPDINRRDFARMLRTLDFKGVATLFCHDNDLALIASSVLRAARGDFKYRAGVYRHWWPRQISHRIHPFLLPELLDTVDASGLGTTTLNHGYFSNDRRLLEEISRIINKNQRAKDRQTLEVHTTGCNECGKRWWQVQRVLPEDVVEIDSVHAVTRAFHHRTKVVKFTWCCSCPRTQGED